MNGIKGANMVFFDGQNATSYARYVLVVPMGGGSNRMNPIGVDFTIIVCKRNKFRI